ncbi:MAG: chorismate mutase [bacterium]
MPDNMRGNISGINPAQAVRLKKARRRIDALDIKIVRLLARRMRIAGGLRGLKTSVRDGRREAEVLKNISALAGRFKTDRPALVSVFKTLLKESRRLQQARSLPRCG